MKLLSLVKTTAFLLWFTAGMVLVAVGTSMWAVQATFTATTASYRGGQHSG